MRLEAHVIQSAAAQPCMTLFLSKVNVKLSYAWDFFFFFDWDRYKESKAAAVKTSPSFVWSSSIS